VEEKDQVGMVTGLAWTQVGGELLFIETLIMPGKGKLTVTGKLGDVMQESAQAAVSYVRSRALNLMIDDKFYRKYDIHIHIPEGAIPKDGPSAGVTIATALASLLSGRPVRADVGMTGEITLRGQVLPVGGIKEKILAAHRAGLRTVVLPKRNEKDLDDLPEETRDDMTFVLVDRVDEVLAAALRDGHVGEASEGEDECGEA
jgi:ATP-dependent Lon protease